MYYPNVHQMPRYQPRVMTVTGNGDVSVTPDTVQIQLEVITDNKLLNHAQKENAFKMNQVIDSLLRMGIANENIQTVSYDIIPQYNYVEGEQVFRGYEVRNAIKVKMTDIDQVGNVIDVAVQNGANRVSNIQFTIANENLYYQQALSLALKNALMKARTIAETMRLQLDPTPIKIIEERRGEPIAPRMFAAQEVSGITPIEQGQILVNATVSMQFRY